MMWTRQKKLPEPNVYSESAAYIKNAKHRQQTTWQVVSSKSGQLNFQNDTGKLIHIDFFGPFRGPLRSHGGTKGDQQGTFDLVSTSWTSSETSVLTPIIKPTSSNSKVHSTRL